MFTGIVEGIATIRHTAPQGDGMRIFATLPRSDYQLGESIALDGACFTIVSIDDEGEKESALGFDISQESLRRTVANTYQPGRSLNFERALRLSDRMGGHVVSGHVDAVGIVAKVSEHADGSRELGIRCIEGGAPFLFEKGSVAIQGVSLTVVDSATEAEGAACSVWLVPHTLEHTTLRDLHEGDFVNVEFDWMAKALWNFERVRGASAPGTYLAHPLNSGSTRPLGTSTPHWPQGGGSAR